MTTGKKTMAMAAALAALVATGPVLAAPAGVGVDAGLAARVDARLAKLDVNGDGALSRSEVEAGHRARFTAMDVNGDGAITLAELKSRLEARLEGKPAERRAKAMQRLEARFARGDADGDGRITLAERASVQGEKRIDRLFARVDANGDGLITKAELEAAKEKRGRRGRN